MWCKRMQFKSMATKSNSFEITLMYLFNKILFLSLDFQQCAFIYTDLYTKRYESEMCSFTKESMSYIYSSQTINWESFLSPPLSINLLLQMFIS